MKKINLLNLDLDGLKEFFRSINEPAYRALQVFKWMHQSFATDFAEMTNLSKNLRAKLEDLAEIQPPELVDERIASDGVIKWVVKAGNSNVETVFIPEPKRRTLCISSQVGCTLNCSFCATGKQGFNRNLSLSEIIGQLFQANKRLKELNLEAITNVVMMGMGEPLMNFDSVLPSLHIMQDDNAYGLSKRRVTLSTSGVVPKIIEFADKSNAALAISLHAPNDLLRNELVPINRKYPIVQLLDSCQYYLDKNPGSHVTMEYVMLKGVNDSLEHAKQLVNILKNIECKVNLIPFNTFDKTSYECSSDDVILEFQKYLKSKGIFTTIRKTRGDDTSSACGQLVGDVLDKTNRKVRWLKQVAED